MRQLAWSRATGLLAAVLLHLTASDAPAAQLEVGAGQTYATISDAVTAAVAGDVLNVHAGDYSEELLLSQSGTADEPITIQAASGEIATVIGRVRIQGSYWHLRGLRLSSSPDQDGVRISGDYNVLDGVEMIGGERDGVDGEGIGNQVINSTIHHYDAGDSDAHCIVLNPGAEDWIISGNTLYDCSGDTIQLFSSGPERSIVNILIEDNEMYYTGSISRTENAIDVKNGDGLNIFNNTMYGFPENKVVVFQKGPANIEMRCNIMHTGFTGVEFREEDGGSIENIRFIRNLMYGYSSYALKFDGTTGAEVYHNTFVGIGSDGLRIEGAGVTNAQVANNVWQDTGSIDASGGITASHNGFFNTGNIGIGSPDDVLDDPLLDGSYHIDRASPLFDAGSDVGLGMFEGQAPDIGWFEVNAELCSAPGTGAGGAGAGGGAGATSSGSGSGAGSAVSSGAGGGGGDDPSDDGGCGCRMAPSPSGGAPSGGAGWLLLGLGLLGRYRRRTLPVTTYRATSGS